MAMSKHVNSTDNSLKPDTNPPTKSVTNTISKSANNKSSDKLLTKNTSAEIALTKMSDSRPVPSISPDTGYIHGYEKVTKTEQKRIAANQEVQTRTEGDGTYIYGSPYNTQSTAEYDTDIFKYHLQPNSPEHEDPAFLGFEIYIEDLDKSSPFFKNPNENKVLDFLLKYSAIDDMNKRINLYKEFRTKLFKIFNSTSEDGSDKKISRNYYITSIAGTDTVINKKIIKYPEDKITITLNEDICMTAQYLAELYNNLIYSYRSNRYMIPEHLLRFDMHIKVNDMRKFRNGSNFDSSKPIGTDNIPRTLDKKTSYIIYTLHDCNFNFFESKNTPNDIVVGGFDAGMFNTPANMTFDIVFKSVSKKIVPLLKIGSYLLSNKEKVLIYPSEGLIDAYYFKLNKTDEDLNDWNKTDLNKYVNPIQYGSSTIDQKSNKKKSFGARLKETAQGKLKDIGTGIKNSVVNRIKEKRDELIGKFVGQLKDKLTIKKLSDMGNVYQGDFRQSSSLGSNISKDIIRNLNGNIKDSITSGKSAMSQYIAGFDKKIGF